MDTTDQQPTGEQLADEYMEQIANLITQWGITFPDSRFMPVHVGPNGADGLDTAFLVLPSEMVEFAGSVFAAGMIAGAKVRADAGDPEPPASEGGE